VAPLVPDVGEGVRATPEHGHHLGQGQVTGHAREVLVGVPLSSATDVDRAVRAASEALPAWRRTPPGDRIQPLFRLKALLDTHYAELARVITQECGKTLG